VYLYYTTNPAAGSPIIDIKIDNTPILNGWETARTQNQLALSTDMDEYSGSMWFLHMKRTVEDPKYISEVVIGVGGSDAEAKAVLLAAGCDYMLEKDLNNNVGAHSDYVYLGYKRTSDPNEAIRDLRTTHDDEVDNFVKNGATYYKLDGNLNSYTNIFADDIFLYYTRDARAGTPITSLGTSGSVANWSHGEGGRYVVKTVLDQNGKASDLNDGAGGDYIYLLQTRDKQDEKGAVASMIGNGSSMIVVAMFMVSVVVIAWICVSQKKRRANAAENAEKRTEADESL
jgi:cbb3-type cytochrome oxidase subunit 3